MQLVGILVEAVLQGLAFRDEVVGGAQRHEVEAACCPVRKPWARDAGAQALDEPQALAPGRELLACALEAHVRMPRTAQQPVPGESRPAAEPGPRRHVHEVLLRRGGEVVLARDPESIGGTGGLQRVRHAREPHRQQPPVMRDEAGDAESEVLVGREDGERRGERVRRQLAHPPGEPDGIGGLAQRRAFADERATALALAGRGVAADQGEEKRGKAVGKVLEFAGTAGELRDEPAIAGVERLDPPLPAAGRVLLLARKMSLADDGRHSALSNSFRRNRPAATCIARQSGKMAGSLEPSFGRRLIVWDDSRWWSAAAHAVTGARRRRRHCNAASAWPKPASEMGMPIPASSVWKMMNTAVLPFLSCSISGFSTTTCA